ncbi:MAG TPA: DsbA family protein [Rudaea sp.]
MSLRPPVGPADHAQGPHDAPITLVEYGDFECPYCGAAYPQLKAVQDAMGERLRFVFRNFPLTNAHPHAQRAAEFAEAAAMIDRFWEMHDILYEHQQALDDKSLVRYAERLGFTPDLIESALRGDFADKVRQSFSGGVRSGVNGTPCLFINGARFDGPAEAETLIAVFREMLGA